jgi:hypothetical protein
VAGALLTGRRIQILVVLGSHSTAFKQACGNGWPYFRMCGNIMIFRQSPDLFDVLNLKLLEKKLLKVK